MLQGTLHKTPSRKQYLLFFLLLLGVAVYCYKRPAHNWDMLAYMALTAHIDHANFEEVHTMVYDAARRYADSASYKLLVLPSNAQRHQMHTDYRAFQQAMPFYIVKPLYIGCSYLFYKLGFNLVTAVLLPSVLAFLGIGMLLFHWLSKYAGNSKAMVLAFLFMCTPPFISSAKLATPDCLSALLLFCGMYVLLQKSKHWTAFIFFALSITARLDNIIAATMLLQVPVIAKKLKLQVYILMMLMLAAIYLAVSYLASRYGWGLSYVGDFTGRWYHSRAEYAGSLKGYIVLLKSAILTGLQFSYVMMFFLLAFVGFAVSKVASVMKNTDHIYTVAAILIIIVRLLLFPSVEDRFNLAYYLIIYILLIKQLSDNMLPKAALQE